MKESEFDGERQADHLFLNNLHDHQNSVVVIGWSGEWWHFREFFRPAREEPVNFFNVFNEEGGTTAGSHTYEIEKPGQKDNLYTEDHDTGMDIDDIDGVGQEIVPEFEIEADAAEPLVDNIADAWPARHSDDDDPNNGGLTNERRDGWSGYMRIGTPASNQRMYLIHRRLEDVYARRMTFRGRG